MPKIIIQRYRSQAQEYVEDLGDGVELEMVLIPEGSFLMGSSKDEEGHNESESPQHLVSVQTFFFGKYPVTQLQWKTIAALPQINRKLKAEPSMFKGSERPVEQVSWYDAVEFCNRLSYKTGRKYRLPSESEWEYACRAGTTTPFHFGQTITTDLANYRGTDNKDLNLSGSYGLDLKGSFRQETTPVGGFHNANTFGLFDMHGNVWEWCTDRWHSSYVGAPANGSAWEDSKPDENQRYAQYKVLRGGSWGVTPSFCRSAFRNFNEAGYINNVYGFRIVCTTM